MMKRGIYFLLLFLAFGVFEGFSQENNWVQFDRDYYKIPTASDGIHRISTEALQASGVNLNTTDSRFIRLYHRGEEVAIHISGGEDGSLDTGDYIDFYGKRNDGTLDHLLYTDFDTLPNPYFNSHTDTTVFFLTVTPGVSGKRMALRPAPDNSNSQVSSYHTEQLQVYGDQYSLGRSYTFDFRLSSFDQGQGWMSTLIRKSEKRAITFESLGQPANGGSGFLEIGLVGRSANPHESTISVGPSEANQRVIQTESFLGYEYPQLKLPLNASDFASDGTLVVIVQPNGPEGADNQSVAYAKVTFEKSLSSGDFDQEIYIRPSGDGQISLSQTTQNYVGLVISDSKNPEKLQFQTNGNLLSFQAEVPNDSSIILIQNESEIVSVGALEQIRFRDLLGQPADYILLGHEELEKPSSQFQNPLQAYEDHRSSALGGGFEVLTVFMEELYDQFGYGEKSSVAIFEFLRKYYPLHKPTHMLLSGRALAIYSSVRVAGVTSIYRNDPTPFSFQSLIPTGGYPFSDNSYVVGLDPTKPNAPALALGRIPARNSQELSDYLEKVVEKDVLGVTESWQKEITHLGGGVSEFELNRYYNFLNGFKSIAEGPFLGGNVSTYRKRSNSTVEIIDISGDLNEGRSLLTFFGHGAPTIIDIEIGFVSDPTLNYQNKGKYPIMLFNGCDYGSAYGTTYTQGEDWILTPEKGATNLMANASIGVDIYLRRYSELFYQNAFADSTLIYRTVGEIKLLAEDEFIKRYGLGPLNVSHMEQMIMLGDPATRIFPADKADYAILEEEVSLGSFDDEPLTVLSDSIQLSFVLRNIGIVNTDSLDFKVTRTLPEGEVISYDPVDIAYVSRADTLFFTVPNRNLNSAGENIFTVELNPGRNIEEMTFANNIVSVNEFIPLSGTLNISPLNYGIATSKDISAVVQIPGKSTSERTLIIQLDTAKDFSSAFKKETRISTRGLAEWPLELLGGQDSTTYYWRSKFQEIKAGEADVWTTSSFSLIESSPEGWTQRVTPQLEQNQLDNLEIDVDSKSWKYLEEKLGIEVFTVGAGVDTLSFRNTQFYLNEIPQIIDNVNNANSRLCPNGSLGLVAFDKKTLIPYLAVPVPGFDILDARACGRVPQLIQSIQNSWITTPGQRILQDYVQGVKEGDYVVIFSVGNVTFDSWPDQAYASLREFGANEATMRGLKTGDPYILYGQKGMRAGEAIEIIGNPDFEVDPNQQTLSFQTDLTGYLTSGWILTPKVGPARNWERFFQNVNARNWINEEDNTAFEIIGVQDNGEEQVLQSGIFDSEIDLSFISASTYPYLRLRYSMDDPESTAPAQLDRWQVNYTGVPEGVLTMNANLDEVLLREGEESSVTFQFANISNQNFLDSIQVDWSFTNVDGRKRESFSQKFPPLNAGERFEFEIPFNSIGNSGANELVVFANPRIQQEQTFRNNQIDLGAYFIVEKDDSNSLLDVNFDGIYIMDGDLVSPNVLINAELKNDQSLVYKQDTVGMEIFLKPDCEGCNFQRINFSNPNLTWTPASEQSSFRVSFLPGPLEDGKYVLRITNEDSPEPYEILFEVVNESQITNFYPYPNPFSTSVRFVFTLTGAEIPDELKIQIMTVTGRVVREILQDELGAIRIGNNITEYAWDGKDEFGDQLANGVYIYRVLVRKNGQYFEHRPTAGDRGFNKGYGKMYLLR